MKVTRISAWLGVITKLQLIQQRADKAKEKRLKESKPKENKSMRIKGF